MSKSSNIQEYVRLSKEIAKREKALKAFYTKRSDLALKPFKTMGIYTNASYILSGLLKNPTQVYWYSRHLLQVKGSGMYFSDDTMACHTAKIFKHFKDIKFLVKVKSGGDASAFELNPALKDLCVKEEE